MTQSEKLRALADFIEDKPWLGFFLGTPFCYAFEKEVLIKAAKLPGARKDRIQNSYFNIRVPFCDEGSLIVFIERERICIAKRTETVTEPAKTYEKVVEWECLPILKDIEHKQS